MRTPRLPKMMASIGGREQDAPPPRVVALALIVVAVTAVVARQMPKKTSVVVASDRTEQGPAIEYLSDPNWDAGYFRAGEQVRHQFFFVNVGDSSLTIDRVAPSCVCTNAMLDRSNIAPGESACLEVAVDTYGRVGSLTAEVGLFQSGAKVASFQLRLQIENGRKLTIRPTRVALYPGTPSNSSDRQFELIVESLVDDPPPLIGLTLVQKDLSLVLSEPVRIEAVPGRSRYAVRVDGVPDCAGRTALATLEGTVQFGQVNLTDKAVIEVTGETDLPRTVFLGSAIAPGKLAEVSLRVPEALAIRLMESPARPSAPFVSAIWGERQNSLDGSVESSIELRIRVTPPGVGAIRERILLGGPACPLSIDVVGAASP